MPFADAGRPAMGVSLLAAEAKAAGFDARVEYFNIGLAETIGIELYQKIASSFPPDLLVGEWFFADDVFGDEIPDAGLYLERIYAPMLGPRESALEQLLEARKRRSDYLDACARTILESGARIVGFTTTFHQTCACLAVARRLKQAPHPPVIVFGGANCEGEMGLQMIRSFPDIDYVCCGEADSSFVELLRRLTGAAPDAPIAGVLEQGKASRPVRSEAVRDMNALPVPDFDSYFERFDATGFGKGIEGHLVMETSRGCWWGAKHHCTFCGLNGDTMAFRSKSPDRAYDEIAELIARYGNRKLGFVDNILDMRYIDTLFPRLRDSGFDLDLFYEVKANLRYDQLATMREGGIRQIQPGIESFSDEVLKLMDKGCTGFQNIQLMRWCAELGIECSWNLLAGFPQESPSEYERLAQLVPLLTHLDPPCSCARIRLDRFSPFHADPMRFGFHNMRPARAYYYVFPLGRQELARIAYFFDFDYGDGRNPSDYTMAVDREVDKWWASRAPGEAQWPRLDAHFDGDGVMVTDTRPAAVAGEHRLAGLAAALLAQCDVAAKPAALAAALGADPYDLAEALEDLVARRLVAEASGKYLSLPVFRTRPPERATAGMEQAVCA
jgi:ribosomal peptide maturation radical SAM protein 1